MFYAFWALTNLESPLVFIRGVALRLSLDFSSWEFLTSDVIMFLFRASLDG
jgi:hypothetical protein